MIKKILTLLKSEKEERNQKNGEVKSKHLLHSFDTKQTDERKQMCINIAAELLEDYKVIESKKTVASNLMVDYILKSSSSTLLAKELDKAQIDFKELKFDASNIEMLCKDFFSIVTGHVNTSVAKEYNLDCFGVVGALNRKSSKAITHLVKHTGFAATLEVNGKYLIKDIPQIIELIKDDLPHWNPRTNSDNFLKYRLGFGCSQEFIPTRLLDRDKKLILSRS